MPYGGSFPDFSKGATWDERQSAREHQNMSNAAKAFAQSRVGSGLASRGHTVSQQIKTKPAQFRTLKIVAVVVEPLPDHYRLVVREVANAFDGADYSPPEASPDDPPPIEPVPAILQWTGDRFYALPGYNHSIAEFSRTWFSDVVRNDNGEPVLVDNEPLEQLPDNTTILHWLYLRPQGPPLLLPMGGGGSDTGFAIVRSVIPPSVEGEDAPTEADAFTSFVVQVQAIRRIPNWPPEEPPAEPELHGGWEVVGDAEWIATYPGIAAFWYKPFVWNGDLIFPDFSAIRTFTVDGETYAEQTPRWAPMEVPDNVRISACTPHARITEETP